MSSYIWPPSGGGAGVSSLNGETGDLTLVAGTGISITPSGTNITIANTQNAFTPGNLTDAGTDGITITGGTNAVNGSGTSISQHVADSTHNGYLSSTDWNTFNNKQSALTLGNLTDAGTDGIVITGGTGAVVGSGTSIAQHVADSTHNGYLSSADWSTFNAKQPAGSYITSLTGDVTASGPGAAAASLVATTNSTLTTLSALSLPGSQVTGDISGNAANVTGTVLVTHGGTGLTTLTANNVILGNGTSSPLFVAPGTSGNVLTSNGTTWVSSAATSGITQLTGDVTAGPGTGSQAATLATVNSNVGSFGSSTSIPNFTVNAKGLITAAGGNAVIAPAGTLSGTTLNATVVSSSLTSVGTLTSGTWNASTITETHGGTNQTSYTTGDVLYASASNTLSKLPIGSNGNYLTITAGTPAWTSVTPGSPFDFFVSSQVTTSSSTISSGTFTTFSNSPAFTFTPNFTATYKVYASVPLDQVGANNEASCRIFNTSGGATLLYESQTTIDSSSTEIIASLYTQSVYSLTAGNSYVFDIQGKTTGGTIAIFASTGPFYMFAERMGN